ncbi:uncharacterized protein LOC116258063 [Nymphaea colorata]|nr:uncharacterized protein LOC116258063 [Nymphaea colorata]XP_031491003.1 uncharacterized protein LOC116258063 [Nymphaea colorata]XP_031491005.1 uncharacterized protein LOC116258063 [Nymphaea colorata]
MRTQQPGMSQSQARPLPGFGDMKLLQQQYFYKQLQEIRQRQLQQLEHEPGQQNSVGQFSAFARQAGGDQATAVVNGTPMYDTSNYMWSGERMPQSDPKTSSSQAFMLGNTNMVRTASSLQGFHNGLVLSQEQARAINSMGLMPQQFGQSTYGASLGGIREASGNSANSFPNLQWGAQENTDMFTRATGNQNQKTGMQSNAFGSFYGDQSASFSGQVPANDGLSVSKQSFHGRNVFGQVSNALESVNSGMCSGNFQQSSSLMRDSAMQEFQRQEHVGWLGNMEEKIAPQAAPPQGSIGLDPLEEKILYGGDDRVWSPADGEQPLSNSFSRVRNMSAGSFGQGNHLEGSESSDFFNMFPSVQSGSWSALMLSAVAEASSSDTRMQDEWSGLSFQKTEVSTGNPSELNDNGRQGAGWNDLNIQAANSLSSKPVHLFDNVNMTSTSKSAGFQQVTPKLAFEHSGQANVHGAHGFLNNDHSSESLRRSPREGRWLEQNSEERAMVDRTVRTPLALGNSSDGAWRNQTYGQQESVHPEAISLNALSMQSTWTHQQQPSMVTYRTDGQPSSKMNGWNMNESLPSDGDNLQDDANNLQSSHSNESIVAMQLGRGCDLWQTDERESMRKNENQGWSSIPNLSGRLERAKSPSDSPEVQHDGVRVNRASGSVNIPLEKTQRVPGSCHFDPSSSSNMGADNNVDKYQCHLNQGSFTNHTSKLGDSHENSRERCYLNVTPTEVHASNHFCHGQQAAAGDFLVDNTWSSAKDSPSLAAGSQKPSAYVRKSSTGGPRRFLYHPMGELAIDAPQPSTSKHDMQSQGPQHAAIGEQKILELGHMSHAKSAGVAIANATANSGKGFFGSNSQSWSKGPEDAPSNAVGYLASPASSVDGPMNFYPPKETSQNMLELLNKVDHSNAAKPLGSSSYSPSLDVSEAVISGPASGHMRSNQSSSSQGFGLHLAPPSAASAVPNHVFPSRHVNSDNSRNIMPEAGKGQTWLHGQTSMRSLPHPSEKSQQDNSCNKTAVADAGHEFSSIGNSDTRLQSSKTLIETGGSHYIHNQLLSQQSPCVSGQAMGEESTDLAYTSQVLNRQVKPESSCRQNQDPQDGRLVEQLVPALQAETAGKPAPFDRNPRGETDFTSGLPFFARDNSVTNSQTLPSTSANSFHTENSSRYHTLGSASFSQFSSQKGILQPNRFSPLLHNAWSNMSAQRSMPGVPHMMSRGPLQPISPTTTWVVQAVNDQNLRDRGGTSVSELCPGSKSMTHLPPREDHRGRESPSQSIPSNRVLPIESFGHQRLSGPHVHQVNKNGENQGNDSSQPSKTSDTSLQSTMENGAGSQPSYSLLHQMQAMKNSESDPNNAIKRLRGENDADVSQVASKIGQRNVYGYSASNINLTANSSRILQDAPYPVPDGKSLSCSVEENKNWSANTSAHSLSSNTHPQDMAGSDRNKSQNYLASCFTLTPPHPSLRGAGYSHPNSPMANSWFEQFGTYKNGQFLTTSDRFAVPQNSAKAAAQQFFFGRVSENSRSHAIVEQRSFSDVSQLGSVTTMPSSTTVVAAKDHPSLVHMSQPDANSQVQVLMKQKKRKTASLEVLPWHKVVTHTSRSLRSISFAELRWASATNRQREKIDDEAEMIDDMLLTPGPRRRIIFTTQLMQQIFCPLPAALLSADANSMYETATYILAKLSLGDACSLVSSLVAAVQNDDKDNKTSVQPGSFGRLTARCLSGLVEGFLDKAGKLENDFLRLEKGPSLLDIRIECQDLERFSIINRFARFHGRGPTEGAPADRSASGPSAAPSSFDSGILVPRKLSPQRYVTAVPMPKNLPEGLQCHSL